MPAWQSRSLAVCATLVSLFVGAASTQAAGPEGGLDSRGWELVSPVDKGGGQVGIPDEAGAGAFLAATAGGGFAFGARDSFGEGAGAPPVSQYLATRSAGGWVTANVSPPLLSGTYSGGAYQLFSADLSRGLLSNGWRCRDGAAACSAQNPPLDPQAPAGYRTLYLGEAGGYQSLLSAANSPALSVPAESFELELEGASEDLEHAVFATCAALTAEAIEVPAPPGCDPAEANLYRWSDDALSAVNLLPAQSSTTPGARLAAPSGAISDDGSVVYWTLGDDLYVRDGDETRLVAGEAAFQVASADGLQAIYLQNGHLQLYSLGSSQDLTPSGGVQAVLAALPTNPLEVTPYVYYVTASGLFIWHAGSSQKIANGADPGNSPPATGSARISADGSRLAFVSSASLTGFANAGKPEVYLYDATADHLACISCNPFAAAPLGPSTIPGTRSAGGGPASLRPRALSADGNRLFFDSADRLVSADSDGEADVYQWEAQGSGSCTAPGGCVGLVSSGRAGADLFLDADADGTDAFFLTPVSLVGKDKGGIDVYDARASGGFSEAPPVVPCEGDACQGPVPGPTDLIPATASLSGPVNPPPTFLAEPAKKKKKAKKKGKKNRGKQKAAKHRGARS